MSLKQRWQALSKTTQWVTGTLVTLISTVGIIAGAIAATGEQIDKMVTTEEEHDKDVATLLKVVKQNQRNFELYQLEEKKGKLEDQRNRNIREVDRLDRELAGGKYNNQDEKDAMLVDIGQVASVRVPASSRNRIRAKVFRIGLHTETLDASGCRAPQFGQPDRVWLMLAPEEPLDEDLVTGTTARVVIRVR